MYEYGGKKVRWKTKKRKILQLNYHLRSNFIWKLNHEIRFKEKFFKLTKSSLYQYQMRRTYIHLFSLDSE
jgi:hypothetical protein